MDRSTQVFTASGLNIFLGIWVMISPSVLGYSNMGRSGTSGAALATSLDLIVGFVIALIAAIRFFGSYRLGIEMFHSATVKLSWLNAALGLLLIASPFLFQFTDLSRAYWNNIIAGAFIAMLSVWNAKISRPAVT